MEVALMIPCYIDVFYPQVGIATLELLERLGVDVVYPEEQSKGFRLQSECRVQPLRHNYIPRLFHIYVMPCCRGKRILGLGLPL